MDKETKPGILERFGTSLDLARSNLYRYWKLAKLMAKGAYLVGERRRLFEKLGEEVYFRSQKGEFHDPELSQTIHQLNRMTKKLEIEEMFIRSHKASRAEDLYRSEPLDN